MCSINRIICKVSFYIQVISIRKSSPQDFEYVPPKVAKSGSESESEKLISMESESEKLISMESESEKLISMESDPELENLFDSESL